MKVTRTNPLQVPTPQDRAARAKTVAREFEALFASFMLRAMRKTVGDGGLVPRSIGDKIYTDMLDVEYAKIMSNNGNFGLADLLYKEMTEVDGSLPSVGALDALNTQPWMYDSRFVPSTTGDANPESVLGRAAKWEPLIAEASERYGVDKDLITAVIAQESAGNPRAVSRAGAKGLMQLMDSTARDLGTANVFNPRENILSGTRYLKMMLDRFGGDEKLALASYNAGPSAVERYGDIPPYAETQSYVRRVLSFRDTLSQPNGEEPHASID